MKLTSDPKRIERAHYLLQRLEDDLVGNTGFGTHENHVARHDRAREEVLKVIRLLNEAYDKQYPMLP